MSDPDERTWNEENLAISRNIKLLTEQKRNLEAQIDPLHQLGAASALAFEDGLTKAILGVIEGTKTLKEGFLPSSQKGHIPQ